jgi:hypothetical protein
MPKKELVVAKTKIISRTKYYINIPFVDPVLGLALFARSSNRSSPRERRAARVYLVYPLPTTLPRLVAEREMCLWAISIMFW